MSRARCVAALAGHPVSVGAVTTIVLGAIGAPLVMLSLLLVWGSAIWRGSRAGGVQRAAARARHARQLRDRRDRREWRLEAAGAPRCELQEATALVDEVAALAPAEVAAIDLEELLDRYAELAVTQARCRALALAHDRGALRHRAERLAGQGAVGSSRLKVLERRIACADRYHERIAELDEAMLELLELVRLSAASIALHQIMAEDRGEPEDPVAVRLGWIDDERA